MDFSKDSSRSASPLASGRQGPTVVIRYFIAGLTDPKDGSLVKWKNAPFQFNGHELRRKLQEHYVNLEGMHPQVYEDEFQGYHNLDEDVVFSFAATKTNNMVLTVRLTPVVQPHPAPNLERAFEHFEEPAHTVVKLPNVDNVAVAPAAPHANPGPLGVAAFSMTTFFLMLLDAEWVEPQYLYTIVPYALIYGGLVQLLVGMWEIKRNNLFGTLVFTSYGAFWICVALENLFTLNGIFAKAVYLKGKCWFYAMWSFYTFIFFLCTFRTNRILQAVFGTLTATLVLLSIGVWYPNVKKAGAYMGMIMCCFASYLAFAELINEVYQCTVVPLFPVIKKPKEEDVDTILQLRARDQLPTLLHPEDFNNNTAFGTPAHTPLSKITNDAIKQRAHFDSDRETMVIDLSNIQVRTVIDVQTIKYAVQEILGTVGKKVNVEVYYDEFECPLHIQDTYTRMVKDLERDYYLSVHRLCLKSCQDQSFVNLAKSIGIKMKSSEYKNLP